MTDLQRRQRRVRIMDLALLVGSAPVWMPLLALIALIVLISSGRPVLFVQNRIGAGRQPFRMLKFRSMIVGDNPVIPDASRITAIGGFLRRTSLDELPQLLHVASGNMSLVGPRPMLPEHSDRIGRDGSARFLVRPGLTGLAQVNGRNAISWDERLEFDKRWVQDLGVANAAAILARTASVVVTGSGIDGHDPADPTVAGTQSVHLRDHATDSDLSRSRTS